MWAARPTPLPALPGFQAYVVRMFGSKEDLFAEVCARAGQRVADAFRAAIAQFAPDATLEEKLRLLGETYGSASPTAARC